MLQVFQKRNKNVLERASDFYWYYLPINNFFSKFHTLYNMFLKISYFPDYLMECILVSYHATEREILVIVISDFQFSMGF